MHRVYMSAAGLFAERRRLAAVIPASVIAAESQPHLAHVMASNRSVGFVNGRKITTVLASPARARARARPCSSNRCRSPSTPRDANRQPSSPNAEAPAPFSRMRGANHLVSTSWRNGNWCLRFDPLFDDHGSNNRKSAYGAAGWFRLDGARQSSDQPPRIHHASLSAGYVSNIRRVVSPRAVSGLRWRDTGSRVGGHWRRRSGRCASSADTALASQTNAAKTGEPGSQPLPQSTRR